MDEAVAAVDAHAAVAVYRVSINNASPSRTCKPSAAAPPLSLHSPKSTALFISHVTHAQELAIKRRPVKKWLEIATETVQNRF